MEQKKKGLTAALEIPEGVEVIMEGSLVTIRGPKGEVKKKIPDPTLKLSIEGSRISIAADKAGKRAKKNVGSLKAHIKNMLTGVTQGYTYRLKICSSHFPMNISVRGNAFVINNFLGEKTPRVLELKSGLNVRVDGAEIVIDSADKEAAGSAAAAIESLTRRSNFDRRIFQDGIYITVKA